MKPKPGGKGSYVDLNGSCWALGDGSKYRLVKRVPSESGDRVEVGSECRRKAETRDEKGGAGMFEMCWAADSPAASRGVLAAESLWAAGADVEVVTTGEGH